MRTYRRRFSSSGNELSVAYKTLWPRLASSLQATQAPHDPPGECGSMEFFLFKISPQKTHPRSQMAQNLFKLSRTDTARLYNPLTWLPNFWVNELLFCKLYRVLQVRQLKIKLVYFFKLSVKLFNTALNADCRLP